MPVAVVVADVCVNLRGTVACIVAGATGVCHVVCNNIHNNFYTVFFGFVAHGLKFGFCAQPGVAVAET